MTTPPVTTGMLIRRPVSEVFQAFTEPGVTSWFWFTHADRRLTVGSQATWTWGMYGVSTRVAVKAMTPDHRILLDWHLEDHPSEIEILFEERGRSTFVEIINRGFEDTDEGMTAALDAKEGFALVLAGAKLWLEQAIEPRFVLDRFPDQVREDWKAR